MDACRDAHSLTLESAAHRRKSGLADPEGPSSWRGAKTGADWVVPLMERHAVAVDVHEKRARRRRCVGGGMIRLCYGHIHIYKAVHSAGTQ